MKKEFTKEYITKNKGCYSIEQVEKLSFINKEVIIIYDLLNSEMPFKDKGWWVIRKCELTNKEKAELAYELAYAVLPIFENKYPEDKRVRECFEAIKLFNNGEIDRGQLRVKRNAAADAADVAAYDAAHVADVAAGVADVAAYDAAHVAADAAHAVAYAAHATHDAAHACVADAAAAAHATHAAVAYAADAAAYVAAYQKIILDILINFVKTH